MDTEHPIINGIDLKNYYASQRSYNSVVYVHKKLLEQKKEKLKEKEKKKSEVKEKKAKNKKKNVKCDKSQQCNNDVTNELNAELLGLSGVLGQSLQFTKTLVPVVIPPSGTMSPIYYTIKASKKHKKKTKADISGHTYKKERCKKIVETFRNENGSQKESISEVKETISYSSQNDTLDELQINPSLCCTFSDVSEQKQIKKPVHAVGKREKSKHNQKVVTSESFEALATEFLNTSGDTKIKIHLMNETEKNLLADNIRVPLLNAIRESILEINKQSHHNTEITTVHKFVKCNTQKLDSVMDKLTCIENKIDNYIAKEQVKPTVKCQDEVKCTLKSPRVQAAQTGQVAKASTLEMLGEDLLELEEESSGDEYYRGPSLSARKRAREKKTVVQLDLMDNPEKREVLGGGEDGDIGPSEGGQLVRPDRPNRIPARFCWTDAARAGKKA